MYTFKFSIKFSIYIFWTYTSYTAHPGYRYKYFRDEY